MTLLENLKEKERCVIIYLSVVIEEGSLAVGGSAAAAMQPRDMQNDCAEDLVDSSLISDDATEANRVETAALNLSCALVGARKRKALRVVKHQVRRLCFSFPSKSHLLVYSLIHHQCPESTPVIDCLVKCN